MHQRNRELLDCYAFIAWQLLRAGLAYQNGFCLDVLVAAFPGPCIREAKRAFIAHQGCNCIGCLIDRLWHVCAWQNVSSNVKLFLNCLEQIIGLESHLLHVYILARGLQIILAPSLCAVMNYHWLPDCVRAHMTRGVCVCVVGVCVCVCAVLCVCCVCLCH